MEFAHDEFGEGLLSVAWERRLPAGFFVARLA